MEVSRKLSARLIESVSLWRKATALRLLTLDVHCVIAHRLRRYLLPPMRRLRWYRDYITLAEMVSLPAFNRGSSHFLGGGSLGIDHGTSGHEDCLTFNHDEDVVCTVMVFHRTSATTLGQDN